MSGIALGLTAACVVASLHTEVRPTSDGWREYTELELIADGDCHQLELTVPFDARWIRRDLRLDPADARKRRVGEDHWAPSPPDPSGEARWAVLLPELRTGDRALITWEIALAGQSVYRWHPGELGARFAELEVGGGATWVARGEVARDRAGIWVAEPPPELQVWVQRDAAVTPVPIDLQRTPGDPQGLSAAVAHDRVSGLVLLARGMDGASPLVGLDALRRGAADDRGVARTLVLSTREGPDRVELGAWLDASDPQGTSGAEVGEVAVWWQDDGPTLLTHPQASSGEGQVWTASGVFTPTRVRTSVAPALNPEDEPVEVHRDVTLGYRGRDPQVALVPGRGSWTSVQETLTFPPTLAGRSWIVELGRGAGEPVVGATHGTQPGDPVWTWRPRGADVALVIGPHPRPFSVTVGWSEPDASACGQATGKPGEQLSQTVQAPGGVITWEEDWWRLTEWDGVPILPDRERLLTALDYRFTVQSLPEPGLPLGMKNQPASWDLVALLRPTLYDRALPGPLAQPAASPRGLSRARRLGAVTPLEAALIVRLYALQARIPAEWVMVRPASLGAASTACPAAYPDALVAVTFEGETRWIDPSCASCAPFELRPDLEGATALAHSWQTTPPPTPGLWEVEVQPTQVSWRLEGPAALAFRTWLGTIPTEERSAAIAARLAGPGAELLAHAGIAEAGVPIALQASRVFGVFAGEDPLSLPPADPNGSRWLSWQGERRLSRPGRDLGEALEVDGVTYERRVEGDRIVESLTVLQRRLSADGAAEIEAVRGLGEP